MADLVYSFDYNREYDPAFPQIEIGIRNPENPQNEARFTVLVDSGSDITLLPADLLVALNATYVDDVQIRGLFGGLQRTKTYYR